MTASNQGFAGMSKSKLHDIASEGGKASSGSFKKGSKRASDAGKKGAEAQPIEAKRRGGMNSHRTSQ